MPRFKSMSPLNSNEVALPVGQGQMIMFPAWLRHSTDPLRIDGKDRISIAFNVMFKGQLGRAEFLTASSFEGIRA